MTYIFDEYELDLQRYELHYAGKTVKLEPQVFDLLAYLIQHRNHVVSKHALLEQLWPGRFVTEAMLTSRVMAARRAVGDRGREQHVIQTLHGRGYRFVAEVEERYDVTAANTRQAMPPQHPTPVVQPGLQTAQLLEEVPADTLISPAAPGLASRVSAADQDRRVVGREAEFAQLHCCLDKALDGTRQIVFWCREPDGHLSVDVLARQAPTWLVQLPCLLSDPAYEVLQRRVQGATRERMLRGMVEAIEALTVERPLVLVIDNLHWSDYATLDLVALLAQRREPACFLRRCRRDLSPGP